MRKKISNSHRSVWRPGLEIRVLTAYPHFRIRPLRQEFAYGVIELKSPLLVQHHQRHGRYRLRHRVDAVDRVLLRWLPALGVHQPERREVCDLAAPGHQRQRAGNLPGVDVALREKSIDPPEAVCRQSGGHAFKISLCASTRSSSGCMPSSCAMAMASSSSR